MICQMSGALGKYFKPYTVKTFLFHLICTIPIVKVNIYVHVCAII